MQKEKIEKAATALFGEDTQINCYDNKITISYFDTEGNLNQEDFSTPISCYLNMLTKMEKLGVDFYLARYAPGVTRTQLIDELDRVYATGIIEFDMALLTGFNRGPRILRSINLKRRLETLILARRENIRDAIMITMLFIIFKIVAHSESFIGNSWVEITYWFQKILIMGIMLSVGYAIFALWRNYQDRRQLEQVESQ